MRPALFILLLTAACNADRPQCHQMTPDADAIAVTCAVGKLPRITAHGRLTVIDCVPKGDR